MSNRNRAERPAAPPLVLASGSPRRHEYLALLGAPFRIQAPDVPEEPQPGERPTDLALRLSLAKAEAVAARFPEDLVLAADTIVVLEGRVLGKPADPAEAVAMLRALGGREHVVYTALALVRGRDGLRRRDLAGTPVRMAPYTEEEIARYVATGDPLDKAGAYAIQAEGFSPVERFRGCYANVVGLPMCHLYRTLGTLGYKTPVHPLDACPLAAAQGCPWSHGILHAAP